MISRRVGVLVKRFPKLSETFIFGEIAALVESGLDIQIISLQRPNETLQQSDANRFSDRITYLEPKSGLRALVDACDRLEIGHLHAHYISEPALLADQASRLRGTTYSVSAHAKDIYLTDTTVIRERLKSVSFVSTCTAHNYEYLTRLCGGNSSKIHLVYHGIDSERFCPAEKSSLEPVPLLIAVGRYKEKKGFDLLIAACASLLNEGVVLQCEIIGYGDQQATLQQLITDKGLDAHVRLRTPVNHDELVGILQNAALCVLPCRQTKDGDRDGIPNAMLEAMSCAVPVVSTSVSGIPEVIRSGVNGVLVEPENPLALANAIRFVLDDTDLQQRLADGGRHTIREMFSWRTNMAVLGVMLRNTISGPHCGEHV